MTAPTVLGQVFQRWNTSLRTLSLGEFHWWKVPSRVGSTAGLEMNTKKRGFAGLAQASAAGPLHHHQRFYPSRLRSWRPVVNRGWVVFEVGPVLVATWLTRTGNGQRWHLRSQAASLPFAGAPVRSDSLRNRSAPRLRCRAWERCQPG